MARDEIGNTINLLISIVALLIPIIIFIFSSPENITLLMIMIFSTIGVFLLISYILIYFFSRWREYSGDLSKIKKDNEEIKKSLNLNKLFNNMDVRVKVLESLILNKNKKGQHIDPRIIIWIIVIILLYLFLKVSGVLP
ncbi:hypothetical protein CMI42_06120 [Candidatus Pacearchaeota archaeon]|nr:hypothetical protein [Candidatus Pacearchaeota archaeon]